MTSSPFRLCLNSVGNSPSHFQSYFDNPIELQGSWKVALENISYSSHIQTKPATVDLYAIASDEKAIWTKHPFQYRLSTDECWLGFAGVQTPDFKDDRIESVIETLNAMNNLILQDGDKKKVFGNVFNFSLKSI